MYHRGLNDLQMVIFGSGIQVRKVIRSHPLCKNVGLPLAMEYEDFRQTVDKIKRL